jgi:hypothetical protein
LQKSLRERTEAPRLYALTQIDDELTLSRKWAGARFGDSVDRELRVRSAGTPVRQEAVLHHTEILFEVGPQIIDVFDADAHAK